MSKHQKELTGQKLKSAKVAGAVEMGSNMSHVNIYFSPQHNALTVSVAKCLCQGKCYLQRLSKPRPENELFRGTLPSKRFNMPLALALRKLLTENLGK